MCRMRLVQRVACEEPRIARDDIDATLGFTVVVHRRDQPRPQFDVAQPDLFRANGVLRDGCLAQHGATGLIGATIASADDSQTACCRSRHSASLPLLDRPNPFFAPGFRALSATM